MIVVKAFAYRNEVPRLRFWMLSIRPPGSKWEPGLKLGVKWDEERNGTLPHNALA